VAFSHQLVFFIEKVGGNLLADLYLPQWIWGFTLLDWFLFQKT
jgi:hypothetical protein